MRKLEILNGDVEEEVLRIFDDYLFDIDAAERITYLEERLSLVEDLDLSELDQQITRGLSRAVQIYFPPGR
jgi:hypothetical protein